MPRLNDRTPKYRKHRASGQAIVTLNGRDIYLGPHGTKASKTEYDRLVGEWLARGRTPEAPTSVDITIAELIVAFWAHAEIYYASPEGRSGELDAFRLALRKLRRLYASRPAREFGPLALKALRQAFIDKGWARTFINRQVSRIRQVFKWAAENELLPGSLHENLRAVAGLRHGKTDAVESEPVRPVSEHLMTPVLPLVALQVAAMIRLQMLTGMRSAEVCQLRGCDIDVSGKLWTFTPAKHKTQHHGHERTIYLGSKCQDIVRPFLKPDVQAYLFSPIDADAWHRQRRTDARKTPLRCGNRPGSNVVHRQMRKPCARYTTASYRLAIGRGSDLAFPPPPELAQRPKETRAAWKARLIDKQREQLKVWRKEHRWHPHQLRHNFATFARKEYGLEAAEVLLGHKTLTVTQVYAEKNVEAAMRIMAEVG